PSAFDSERMRVSIKLASAAPDAISNLKTFPEPKFEAQNVPLPSIELQKQSDSRKAARPAGDST
ncbi:MAG TPA: hypothetical protein VE201_07710, partial [Nitrospirales bacterium]|nr:hypothetical protein [Nitrospirales bacterium]